MAVTLGNPAQTISPERGKAVDALAEISRFVQMEEYEDNAILFRLKPFESNRASKDPVADKDAYVRDFHFLLIDAKAASPKSLVFNLENNSQLDATELLAPVVSEIASKRLQVTLCHASPSVQEQLRILGLSGYVKSYETEGEALSSVGAGKNSAEFEREFSGRFEANVGARLDQAYREMLSKHKIELDQALKGGTPPEESLGDGVLSLAEMGNLHLASVAPRAYADNTTLSRELMAALEQVQGSPAHLVIDFEGVTFLGANVIGALISLGKRCRQAAGKLSLCGLSDSIKESLTVKNLAGKQFGVFKSRAELEL